MPPASIHSVWQRSSQITDVYWNKFGNSQRDGNDGSWTCSTISLQWAGSYDCYTIQTSSSWPGSQWLEIKWIADGRMPIEVFDRNIWSLWSMKNVIGWWSLQYLEGRWNSSPLPCNVRWLDYYWSLVFWHE